MSWNQIGFRFSAEVLPRFGSRFSSGPNRIEGIGMGYVVPFWRQDLVDEIMTVSASDAMAMARRLAREEGLFAGASTGANVVAALRLAERFEPDATVITLMIDTGIKYLSTEVYGPSPG